MRTRRVTNGSFEIPPVPPGNFTLFFAGLGVPGWNVLPPRSRFVNSFTQNGVIQWMDLTRLNANSTTEGVSQAVATTAGHVYQTETSSIPQKIRGFSTQPLTTS